MNAKFDVEIIFTSFMHMVERHFSTKIKSIQTIGDKEFNFMSTILSKLGINRRKTYPHTSEQNKSVKYRHKYVVEKGLALLF